MNDIKSLEKESRYCDLSFTILADFLSNFLFEVSKSALKPKDLLSNFPKPATLLSLSPTIVKISKPSVLKISNKKLKDYNSAINHFPTCYTRPLCSARTTTSFTHFHVFLAFF
jgi:hypothetical protein